MAVTLNRPLRLCGIR